MTNNELLQIKIILNQPIDNKTHFPIRFFLSICANEKYSFSSKVCTYTHKMRLLNDLERKEWIGCFRIRAEEDAKLESQMK